MKEKATWKDFFVPTKEDYYKNTIKKWNKLSNDEFANTIIKMLADYYEKATNLDTKQFHYLFYQFQDFYAFCIKKSTQRLHMLEKYAENMQNRLQDIIDMRDIKNINLSELVEKILIRYGYHVQKSTVKSLEIGQSITAEQKLCIKHKVMAQLCILFPEMKNALTTKHLADLEDLYAIEQHIENSSVIEFMNEYSSIVENISILQDLLDILEYYAFIFKVTKQRPKLKIYRHSDISDYFQQNEENLCLEQQNHFNILMVILHTILDQDFLSYAITEHKQHLFTESNNTIYLMGMNENNRYILSHNLYLQSHNLVLPLMKLPLYQKFSTLNYEDKTVFWKMDRLVDAMIDYVYPAENIKDKTLKNLENEMNVFVSYTYPFFLRNRGKEEKEPKVKKKMKVMEQISEELIKQNRNYLQKDLDQYNNLSDDEEDQNEADKR